MTTAAHVANGAPTAVRTAPSAATPATVPAAAQLRLLRWAVRATLTLGVAASVAANILHARPNPISQLIAAWPPLALLLTVELISRVPTHRRCLAGIRLAATAGIAAIAAWVSYSHMVGVAAHYGETEAAASYLLPLSVDGLVIVASVSLVEITGRIRADHDQRPPAPLPPTATAPAADTPARDAPTAPARARQARKTAVRASGSRGHVGGSEAHLVRHAALADMAGAINAGTRPAPPDITVTMPTGSSATGDPPSPDTPSPAGTARAAADPVNSALRHDADARAVAGRQGKGGSFTTAVATHHDGSSNRRAQAAAADSAGRPADGQADEQAQAGTTAGDMVPSGTADDMVPSGTAAAVAYWYRRNPRMHPAEIGARISRSERTVRRYWPPATGNGGRVNGNHADDPATSPPGR